MSVTRSSPDGDRLFDAASAATTHAAEAVIVARVAS
jgi:hypothetical protein